MRPTTISTTKLSVIAIACLAGCTDSGSGKNATPLTVESELHSLLPPIIQATADTLSYAEEAPQLLSLGESMEAFAEMFDSEEVVDAPPEILPASHEESEIDPDEIATFLVEEVFSEENYLGSGDYAISAHLVCGANEEDDSVDADCVQAVEAITPIIHVESIDDGLDFDFLIGESRHNPLTIELRETRVSVVVDLAEAKSAAETISLALDEPFEIPATVRGVSAATLRINGPGDISFEAAVREDIEVIGSTDEGDISVQVGASDPSLSLRINAPAQEITAALDAANTQVSLPYSLVDEEGAGERFIAELAGLSATILLSDAQERTTISNLGFGDEASSIRIDDNTIFEFNFNQDAGRRVDLEFSGSDTPTLGFSPSFDANLFVDLARFATDEEEIPNYLQGETYSLTIDGSEPSIQVVEGVESSGVRVVSGQMRIASDAGSSVVVSEGQCLLESELESGEHELLGHLEAGSCSAL